MDIFWCFKKENIALDECMHFNWRFRLNHKISKIKVFTVLCHNNNNVMSWQMANVLCYSKYIRPGYVVQWVYSAANISTPFGSWQCDHQIRKSYWVISFPLEKYSNIRNKICKMEMWITAIYRNIKLQHKVWHFIEHKSW
jgi:hypothetical protein